MSDTQLSVPRGLIDLGVGQPSLSLLPVAAMRDAARRRLAGADPTLLQYGAERGDGAFRTALADFLGAQYGTTVDADALFVTAGASQSLDLLCSVLAEPGDTIYVEEPSYFLALRLFADHGLRVVGVPTDADGLVTDALEDRLQRHGPPAFLYTIPVHHNPSTATLSPARRRHLLGLARQHDFSVVADEVYELLTYRGTMPPPLGLADPESPVLSLGSFSKILAPGLRLGWIRGPEPMLARLADCGLLRSGGGLNPFVAALVGELLTGGEQAAHLAHLREVYGQRAGALAEAVRDTLGDRVELHGGGGGFFLWLRLRDGRDATLLLETARRHGIAYQPGSRFSSAGGLTDHLRLSFSYYDIDELREGVRRLALP